jgi:hypothetical protein
LLRLKTPLGTGAPTRAGGSIALFLGICATGCSDGGESRSSPTDAGALTDVLIDAADSAVPFDATDGSSAPALLSETGLFSSVATRALADGVRPFAPRFALWSDGASKERWLYLPDSTRIDTTDLDHWQYPVGTKAWKEFRVAGVPVETRLLEKTAPGQWRAMAYHWRADGSDAEAVPAGLPNASGTEHDIPAETDCRSCHANIGDVLLGVSAIQLAGATPLSLEQLQTEGRLTSASTPILNLPGSERTQAALGYLHANCGNCHNPRSKLWATLNLRFWLSASAVGSVAETATYRSAVAIEPAVPWGGATARIAPGLPERSAVFLRMQSRGNRLGGIQLDMPPLASEKPDPDALELVRDFIVSLAADAGS